MHAIRGTFFRSKSLSPHSNSTFLSPVFVGVVRTLCCALAKSSYDLIPFAGEIVVQPMSSLWYLLILLTCHYVVMCNPNVSAKSRGYVFFLFTQFVVSWGVSVIGICESIFIGCFPRWPSCCFYFCWIPMAVMEHAGSRALHGPDLKARPGPVTHSPGPAWAWVSTSKPGLARA